MKKMQVEQTLHGYLDGHHLLASSAKLLSKSEKIMSVLSDLSGPEIYNGFTEYLTGYPLPDDKYYVIAKTWYAAEMKRPGCVWTHSLLIRFEDLNQLLYCEFFENLFKKPNIESDKSFYFKTITISSSDLQFLHNNHMLNLYKLEYLMWAIFNHDQPIIIPSDTSFDYEEETLFLWKNFSNSFFKKISFCTGSLASRKIDDQLFDLQIVPLSLAKGISRTAKNSLLIESSNSDFPRWVENVSFQLINSNDNSFTSFVEIFGPEYNKKMYFRKLAQLYIESDINRNMESINHLFNNIDYIFNNDDSKKIKTIIAANVFRNRAIAWFNDCHFLDIVIDLCTKANTDNLDLSKIELDSAIGEMWNENKDECIEIFRKLIGFTVNGLGEYLIKVYAQFINPSMLIEFTNMDIGACSVLVSANYELAMCDELWRQTKDFQLEIMNCLRDKEISEDKIVLIINTILNNSQVDLSDQLYKVFKEISIPTFLNWSLHAFNNNSEKEKVEKWFKICKKDPYQCIKWLTTKEVYQDFEYLSLFISVLDPYSREVIQFGAKPWYYFLQHINIKEIRDNDQLKLAKFLLPLILKTENQFPGSVVQFAYDVVYGRLAKDQFDYEEWEKLEPLLPEVAWYNKWDKCKRLKKAIKAKGYHVY